MVVLLPLALALYASYPPVGVPVQRKTVEKKVARTPEEARQNDVQTGQLYVASEDVTWQRFLPLALGARDEVTRVVERREDGTVVEEVTTIVQGRVKLGLDVAGGTELLYQLSPEEGERLGGKLGTTIDILKKRIDPSNVKQYPIQAVGQRRILIQVPRATATEVEQLKTRLEKMGKLEFMLAVPLPRNTSEPKFIRYYEEAEQGRAPEGFVRMFVDGDPTQDYYLVKKGEPEITGRFLAPGSLRRTTDQRGFPAVGFEFNAMGVRKFARITETNSGWALAIVLDDVLKSAPLIRGRIYGPGIVEGNFSEDEVSDMVNVLRAGSLPMDITLLQESTVGPQLGRDSIRRGLLALAVAGLLVLSFIGVYYITCGLVADGALILNLVLLMGVLCILGAALTLPGMAGVLLTVGMAV
ncbi:MAG: preprotein translocase subunit SecD, partial [Planctomycetota bacterium]